MTATMTLDGHSLTVFAPATDQITIRCACRPDAMSEEAYWQHLRAAQGAAAPCGHTEQQHRTLHENRVPCMAAQGAAAPPDLDVERLGFRDLLDVADAILRHYPPDTIVCSHHVKADPGARTTAAIADLIASARLSGASTDSTEEPDANEA